jgi:signal transduction histidine kinase
MPVLPANLKLSHKGLILVAVPLVFELVFVTTLAILLKQAEHETWRARHARTVVAESNSLLNNFMNSAASLYMFRFTNKDVFMERYEKLSAEIPGQIRLLKVLLRDSPNQEEALEQIETTSNRAMTLLSESRDAAERGQHLGDLQEQLGKSSKELMDDLGKFVEQQEKAEYVDPQAESEARLLVVRCLMAGIVFNILLAVFLAIYFNKSATQRLNVLVDNTRRLSGGETLHEPVEGGDEISHLDHVFHEMADKLKEAARHKQEMIAMVSHDLRTPLTSVQAALTMLSTGVMGELPSDAGKEVLIAEKNTDRLIDLINDLLDIERLEAGTLQIDPSNVDLAPILESSNDTVQKLAKEKKVNIHIESTGLAVFVDRNRIVQVLVNLLSNAIKFSPPNTTISIEAKELAGQVELRVKDQGRGIPEENLSTVFERFKQVKKSDADRGKGTGLGLAICKAIIDGHGGEIGVESQEGKGSTFWFRVSLAPSN